MNIVVIGLGSMGKRRIRLISKILNDVTFYAVDSKKARCDEMKDCKLSIKVFSSIEEIPSTVTIDAAFICTSPMSHSELITDCLNRGWNIFTEINLSQKGYEKNIALARNKGLLLYLSSTPLFRNDIQYITKKTCDAQEPISYIYHVGQYLPDWHPWENYKDFFVGDAKSNGCREIMAIELPWMINAFGPIVSVESVSTKQTKLDIDFHDSYSILLTHTNGNKGVFIVDVVCRIPVRFLEVYSENMYITWDGKLDGLREYDIDTKKTHRVKLTEETIIHQEGYNDLIIENDYEEEIMDFFKVLNGEKNPGYSFEKDREVLEWIDRIEKHEKHS